MAVASQEGLSLDQTIIGIMQETRQVLGESQARFPDDNNGKLPALKEAIGQFGAVNLARLALAETPHSAGADGLEIATGFVAAKRAWIGEQARLRDTVIATAARSAYIEAQNALLEELVEGEQFGVSRLGNAAYDAMRTLPEEGLRQVIGPVTGTLSRPRAELGGFILMPAEAAATEPPTERGYLANFLDMNGVVQLDLQVAE